MENYQLKDSLGYFDDQNKEYVIENMYPIRPLRNFLWSDKVCCSINQFGFGDSFAAFNGYRRFIDSGDRLIFVKDHKTGEVYSPNRNFNKLNFEKFCCHVGIGYQKIVSKYNGLECEFKVAIPTEDYAVQYGFNLKNTSDEAKQLSVFMVVCPFTNLTGHDASGVGEFDEKKGGLTFPHYGFECPTDYNELYFATQRKFDSYAVTLRDIVGVYGSFNNPEHINNGRLVSRGSTFEGDYVAGVSYDIWLKPNQTESFNFALAIGKSYEQASNVAFKYATKNALENTIKEQKKLNLNSFDCYQVDIPDKFLQTLVNTWLKRQISLGKSWGRIYGKGFRDVMQDVTAFVAFDPSKARERIIVALSHQYKNGNPIRMFDPDYEALYNDGATWIPDAVTTYIKESGDYQILDEVVKYLNGGKDTVYNHIYKGMTYLTTDVGKRGLTLFRRGDWNDSTNGAGNLGIGESVWTTLASIRALKQFAELNLVLGKVDVQNEMLDLANKMTQNVLKHGIVNGHFIHGYDDWGNIVGGGNDNDEASFCLNPQTWAVLADVGDKTIQNAIMDKVEQRLKCNFGYVLNNPPYTKAVDSVGRTSYFRPGLIENASVYIHGSMFKAVADCYLGRGDNAYQTVCSVLYRNNPKSGVEPYAISNMLIGPDSKYRVGEAPMSWITGSAGWMYRAVTEFIIGIRTGYNGIEINPSIPSSWNEFSVKRTNRGATYNFNFIRKGKFALIVNGKKIDGNVVNRVEKGKTLNVTVEF